MGHLRLPSHRRNFRVCERTPKNPCLRLTQKLRKNLGQSGFGVVMKGKVLGMSKARAAIQFFGQLRARVRMGKVLKSIVHLVANMRIGEGKRVPILV